MRTNDNFMYQVKETKKKKEMKTNDLYLNRMTRKMKPEYTTFDLIMH